MFKNKEVSELLEGEEVEHQVCTPGAHEQNVPVERCVKEVQTSPLLPANPEQRKTNYFPSPPS